MATLEQIIEEAKRLSPDEQQKLREALDREALDAEKIVRIPPSRGREQQWIAEHGDEYVGQWVVIEGDQLITHGRDARTVYEAAREAGIAVPFLVRVAPGNEPSMGGW